jgi:hypothetical protein
MNSVKDLGCIKCWGNYRVASQVVLSSIELFFFAMFVMIFLPSVNEIAKYVYLVFSELTSTTTSLLSSVQVLVVFLMICVISQ